MFFEEAWSYFSESSSHVSTDSFWRFICDLDTVLKDADGEMFCWHRTKEESVFIMNGVGFLSKAL